MSRTQRILPQWTYRREIAFTVKDNGIELRGKCRIIYGSMVKKGLWHQQEWSGTYPPQIQHVHNAENLAALNWLSWDCAFSQGWRLWTNQNDQKPIHHRSIISKTQKSCRIEFTVMRLSLRPRMMASNFAPNVMLSTAAWSRKVTNNNQNDQKPILLRSIMSRTQRILPQWTYCHEIAFTVKDDGIKLCTKCCIIYRNMVKKVLWQQQEWSWTYPPQIHHVHNAKNL